MKDTHVLGAALIIFFLAITAVFIGYKTNMLPQHKQRVITTKAKASTQSPPSRVVKKKKDCHCCEDGLVKLREQLEKLREQENANYNVKRTTE